jgi:electron transfer flavoprotein beta subunit
VKIVVCVKHVPDASAERGFAADLTVDREGVDGLLSELDEYAVEQALRIADDGDDVEVVVLTVGPEDARDAIKRALQMGATSGIHVLDDALHGTDVLGTSAVLAAAVAQTGADLVVCGMASTDGAMGVLPAMLAERLGWPAATYAGHLGIADGHATILREDDTARLTVEVDLPAVVSVTDQSGEARYPSMKGILGAKKKTVVTWDLDDLGLEPAEVGLGAARTRVVAAEPRPARGAGRVVTDADGSGAVAVLEFLSTGRYV